ncbi:hypothetical protein IV498_14875 [Paenarthrobacter sp. Z7-10]|uniref:hypothetical protein n=1 Tax=Paenarthrobacter sp. Z7-10 TaxID=2787635 RepID=UPI0022A959AF|nr:hypothetical protein [Paenarthrobacter sp. Z7-10]MCZ2404425.1 hypothetical protein [Paenarthrobacter sp. Z7-10]
MRTSYLVLVTTAPPTDPSLRPGLDANQVSPGFLGFLFTFFIVAIMFFLIRDMVKRIRRVRYRGQVEEEQQARLAAAEDAGEADDAGTSSAGSATGADAGNAADAAAPTALAKRRSHGGSHGPDAELSDSGSQDDGPTDQTGPR